jgi:hypothetical protein
VSRAERAVTGEWGTGGASVARGRPDSVGGVPPGATPPLPPASAAGAALNENVKLARTATRARARKTATSFVGLRG